MLQKRETKYNLIEFLLFLIILYTIMPVFSRFVSSTLTTYTYLLVVGFAFVAILFKKGKYTFEKELKLLMPFLAWKALQLILAADAFLWAYGILLDCIFLVAGYYIVYFCRYEKIKIGVKILIGVCLLTLITTVIGCIQNPEASRILASVESTDLESIQYDWKNIGGYDFVYMMVLMHPLLILAYKKGTIKFFVSLLGTISLFVLAIYSEYTTALLLVIITSLLYFFKKKLKFQNLLFLIIVAVFFVTFFSDIFSDLLNRLADMVNSENIAHRLRALAGGRTGIENSEDNRIELYENSLKTFFAAPLWGTFLSGGGGIGGHSFILDFIAQYGIIGLSIIVLMYRQIYKYFFAPYKDKAEAGYIYWVFIQAIILSFVNTGMWLAVLTFFAPMVFKFLYKDEEK